MEPDRAFTERVESLEAEGTGPTPMRWTICAMLFVATSINYMDRQVIALLKPTLQQSIGLTELNYGYIVDAFQIAYAAGLLGVGRLIDRLGTRVGHVGDGGLESFSNGPCAGHKCNGVRRGSLLSWVGGIRQLPCRDQDRGRVVST